MLELTKPGGSPGEPSRREDRHTSVIPANYLGAAVTLLAGVLACAVSVQAQTHQRATATLRISVTVVPVVSTLRGVEGSFSSPRPPNPDVSIRVFAGQGEPLENLRRLGESPWAEIVLRTQGMRPTPAPSGNPDRRLASDIASPASPRPPSNTLPEEGVLLQTHTYVPD